jgi:hypothetical protein
MMQETAPSRQAMFGALCRHSLRLAAVSPRQKLTEEVLILRDHCFLGIDGLNKSLAGFAKT